MSARIPQARLLETETPPSVGPPLKPGGDSEKQLSAASTINGGAESSPGTHLAAARHLEFDTPSPDGLLDDLDELDKYFVDAGFSPGSAPASATVSDDELAAFEIEIFGFDDIEGVIGTFLADCVDNAVCEITAHSLLVLDPVPSRPVDQRILLDVESVLDIDVGVPIAAARGSTAGGADQAVLDMRAPQAPGRTGDVDLPTSDFNFAWDAGLTAPAADSNPPAVHSSTASVEDARDSGATCGSGGGPGGAHDSSTSLQLGIPAAVPAHSVPNQAVSGPKKAHCTQVQRLRRLVGLHPAVRALLTCSACGHHGHTKETAKRVLGVDILFGCPYEACCLCYKVGHAGRDCRSPTPSDLPALITKWMYAPWLHHSDAEAYVLGLRRC